MADMTGMVLSNRFRVNDAEAFTEWMNSYFFGAHRDTEIRNDGQCEKTGKAMVHIAGSEQYPNAWPRVLGDPDKDGHQDEFEVDLETWTEGLRKHLHEEDVFHLIAGGNEKERYVGYSELAVDQTGHAFQTGYTDDDERARALIANAREENASTDHGPANGTGP